MADRAFKDLKQALTSPPVLALLECDACGVGIDGVLSQKKRPKTFFGEKSSDVLG